MRFWKRRAAKKSPANAKKCCRWFFAPFFQSMHLSNGDLRMRAHRTGYHIIVLLSWFWGIVRSPRSSNVNLECRHLSCDFHQQRMLFFKFYRHILHVFFLGCWFLVRFHRSIEIWSHLSLIRRFYFHHGFGMFWLGIFRGMRSSNVDLECRHWFCDLDEGCNFLGFLPKFLTVYKHVWAHCHIFQMYFPKFLHLYILYIR